MSLKLGITGIVKLDIIDSETNEVIEHWEDHNDIVPYGFNKLLYSIAASATVSEDADFRINIIVFGSNGSPNAVNTGDFEPGYNNNITIPNRYAKLLDANPAWANRKANVAPSSWTRTLLAHKFSLGPSENNGQTIRELALEIEDFSAGGNEPNCIVARVVRAPIVKTAAIRLEGTWFWDFTLSAL